MNLLPYSSIDALRQEAKIRFLVILSISAAIALVCIALLLFALSLYARGQAQSTESLLASARANSGALETTRSELETFNAMARDADVLLQTRAYPSDIVRSIALNLPPDIWLSSFSAKVVAGTGVATSPSDMQVFVSGFAKSRDSLLLFRERLQSQSTLSNVVFPPASWASPNDINFSFTATAQR